MKWIATISAVIALSSLGFAQQTDVDRQFQQKVVDAVGVYKSGNLDGAIRAFEGLYAANKDNSDVLAWLGFLYLRADRPADAIPVLEAAAAKRPKDLEVVNNLGNAYLGTGDLDKAVVQYQQVSQMNPGMFEAWYNIGNICLKKKDYSGALTAYGKASSLKPEDAFVHNNLGVAYESTTQYDLAASEFVRAANLKSDNAVFTRNAGMALVRVKRTQEALPFLVKAFEADSSDTSLGMSLADSYLKLSRSGDALTVYESLKAALPNNSALWFNLGVLRAQKGNAAGAEEAYARAHELAPGEADTMNNLGLLYFRRGDFADAAKMFWLLTKVDSLSAPDRQQAKINQAASLSKDGQRDKASVIWKELIRTNPGLWNVRLNLANALWEKGDSEGAKFHYMQILKSDPNNVEALNGTGLYYLSVSKLAEAEASFRGAMASNPKFVPAYNNLAITLERMNKRKVAIQFLEKALKIDPANKETKENLDRMKAAG